MAKIIKYLIVIIINFIFLFNIFSYTVYGDRTGVEIIIQNMPSNLPHFSGYSFNNWMERRDIAIFSHIVRDHLDQTLSKILYQMNLVDLDKLTLQKKILFSINDQYTNPILTISAANAEVLKKELLNNQKIIELLIQIGKTIEKEILILNKDQINKLSIKEALSLDQIIDLLPSDDQEIIKNFNSTFITISERIINKLTKNEKEIIKLLKSGKRQSLSLNQIKSIYSIITKFCAGKNHSIIKINNIDNKNNITYYEASKWSYTYHLIEKLNTYNCTGAAILFATTVKAISPNTNVVVAAPSGHGMCLLFDNDQTYYIDPNNSKFFKVTINEKAESIRLGFIKIKEKDTMWRIFPYFFSIQDANDYFHFGNHNGVQRNLNSINSREKKIAEFIIYDLTGYDRFKKELDNFAKNPTYAIKMIFLTEEWKAEDKRVRKEKGIE